MAAYTVLLTPDPDGNGYGVAVPALPGCFSQGRDVTDALANAREAIEVYLADVIAHGEPVPREGVAALIATVEVPVEALVGA